ncbi:hypothetical protein QFZ87_003269 [Bacillus sp. SLBN-46]|jgi:hypothetical protein|uniref:hypothetical protein n=1 Tax=Bacillus sp. SLBN-46 TaxID=3042283 RepID=UPI00285E6EBA|nr:hypothetical protein [Bacillus sp. SLBN-46]MDR6123672.1 hypothetical protein [Bacillus sp. SLBN-46]
MEKQLSDLSIFESYRNRQVILNYYQDEDFLWKRDGFHFESIQIGTEQLLFLKGNHSKLSVPINDYKTAVINTQFPNFFILRNSGDRLEIYFP